MDNFINAVRTFARLVIDILKTIPRFFVKFFIVGIFSYPMLLITGFVEQIDPGLVWLFEYPVIYGALGCYSYKERINDSAAKNRYRDGRIIADRFNYLSELVRIFSEELYTLIKDTIAFIIVYTPAILLIFINSADWAIRMPYIIVAITFPLADAIVMLFVRKKWHKEYIEFKKTAKVQVFQEFDDE